MNKKAYCPKKMDKGIIPTYYNCRKFEIIHTVVIVNMHKIARSYSRCVHMTVKEQRCLNLATVSILKVHVLGNVFLKASVT